MPFLEPFLMFTSSPPVLKVALLKGSASPINLITSHNHPRAFKYISNVKLLSKKLNGLAKNRKSPTF